MIKITLNNNKGQLTGDLKCLRALMKAFALKVPGYFFSPAYRRREWDGTMKFVTEAGYFHTGMLPRIISFIETNFPEQTIKVVDNRESNLEAAIRHKVGKLTLRGNQWQCVNNVVTNKVGGIDFPRGIIAASTNAGKTLIAAGIYKAYQEPTLLLINNKPLFDQFKVELKDLLGDDFGYVNSSEEKWGKFTMVMVQTVISRLDKYKARLIKYPIVLVDECHLAASASYHKVLSNCYNAYVRVGMSGSALNHKDKTKNMKIVAYFGEVVATITSKELEENKHSSPLTIRIVKGNQKENLGSYQDEYEKGIVSNKSRNKKIWKLVEKQIRLKRLPLMITVKLHKHLDNLSDLCPKELKADYLVRYIHHKTKGREEILESFRQGKVDILFSSMIIKTGQNLPLVKAMIFGGGGDSDINTLQLIGRGKRKHESKKRTYIYDFYDKGRYILRHSKHRRNVYIREGHTVIDSWKTK
jgi:superfamily II DNA or RNA helicase